MKYARDIYEKPYFLQGNLLWNLQYSISPKRETGEKVNSWTNQKSRYV